MKKPSLAKGTRDFLPAQARNRKYIFEIIERCFIRFGYQALETPAMENLETLTGKYGEEGDKLLFKILNSGDFLKSADDNVWKEKNSQKLIPFIAEKGLRYDLTVPFARVVAMNQHLISFPFKRYQIQPVWRADRPQRGRYREFYQCDADVVGSASLMYEAELMQIYDTVFAALQIPVKIVINHRKILEGIAIEAGCENQFMKMTLELDKLDKTGPEQVIKSLTEIGISNQKAEWILEIIQIKDLDAFRFNQRSELGISDIQQVLHFNAAYQFKNKFLFDASLARGLSYYTGCIFEVVPAIHKMGSLGGGGRYDNLTGVFGLKDVSGVGISFGADRIYDILEESQLFPADLGKAYQALFISLDEESLKWAFHLASQLRQNNVAVDVYPEVSKLKKQFAYAENLSVPYVIIIGEAERLEKMVNIKNQKTGEQTRVKASEIFSNIC
jgi:histidyl-tRNA synthetase